MQRNHIKKISFLLLRILLTVGLLAFLIWRSGIEQLRSLLGGVNLAFLPLVLGLMLVDVILRAVSWGILLRTSNVHLPLTRLVYIYLVGGFLGTFLPSSLGTDVTRVVLLSKYQSVRAEESVLSILTLNLINLLSLCILAFIGGLLFLQKTGNQTIVFMIWLITLAYFVLFPLLLRGRLPDLQIFQRPALKPFIHRLRKFESAFSVYGRNPRRLAFVLGIAFLNHALSMVITYSLSRALDLDHPFSYFVIIMPLITLSRIIPISIAGLGAEQGIFVYLFGQMGVPSAQAFMISLLLTASGLVFAMIGGILFAVGTIVIPKPAVKGVDESGQLEVRNSPET